MFWWANQNQTWRPEINGGYLWSPQFKKDGTRNPFYETMRRADAGDLVFSFFDQKINYLGMVGRPAVACPRPDEFGELGQQWDRAGWLVEVTWTLLITPFRPKDHIEKLRSTLPSKYSPLNAEGNGSQSVYLAAVPPAMGDILLGLGGLHPSEIAAQPQASSAINAVELSMIDQISNENLSETERQSLVLARLGQGRYRQNLEAIERSCRVTGVRDRRLLRASHIKPWRACETSAERLDGNNGLLLAPHIDLLFDRGYITFGGDGRLIVSDAVASEELARLAPNLSMAAVQPFNSAQLAFLEYHQQNVFFQQSPK